MSAVLRPLSLRSSYPTVQLMAHAAKSTTTLSAKGQVILPAAIRRRHNWRAGTRLTVEETADGVLLRPTPAFPSTTTEQVFGCLH